MTSDSADTERRLQRLERRAQRERSAREQAERIAEDGMRRLFLANQELDERVEIRTQELELERQKAARSAGERAEFLRLLSRETRSPLNGVIGVIEVMDDHAESDQMRAWLADGLKSAKALDSIMTRLLLFLDLDGDNTGARAEIDPAEVLSEVSTRWKHHALRAGLLLSTENRCESSTRVETYVDDLHLILDELVGNAVKHGDAGLLRVTAEETRSADGGEFVECVEFVVEDPGPGIADTAPLLDAGFHDLQNTGARGMGYSLVTRLAERTSAEVEIDSASSGGTVVRVTLPRLALS